MNQTLSPVAQKIVYLRQTVYRMSQADFACKLGISQTYLSLIEGGRKQVSNKLIKNICKNLRIDEEWLCSDTSLDSNQISEFMHQEELAEKENALRLLRSVYPMSENEIDILKWFLELPIDRRRRIASALKSIRDSFTD